MNHFKTAKKHIRRAPYQALSAIIIMTITFFVATMMAVLAFSSNETLKYFETRPQIIAFLKKGVSADQISALQRDLQTDSRIKDVEYVSPESALEIYREATSDKPLLSQLVSPKIFPASLEFSVTDLIHTQALIEELEGRESIDQIVYTANLGGSKSIATVIQTLQSITTYIRVGGLTILTFLLVSSLLILLVILGMRISSKREEIEILQLVGATPGFIRTPFVIEGVFYAVAGTFIGWTIASLVALYALPMVADFFRDVEGIPKEPFALFKILGIILGAELLLASLLGMAGSFIAIRRYLKI